MTFQYLRFLRRLRSAQKKAYRYACVVTIHINGAQIYVHQDGHIQNS